MFPHRDCQYPDRTDLHRYRESNCIAVVSFFLIYNINVLFNPIHNICFLSVVVVVVVVLLQIPRRHRRPLTPTTTTDQWRRAGQPSAAITVAAHAALVSHFWISSWSWSGCRTTTSSSIATKCASHHTKTTTTPPATRRFPSALKRSVVMRTRRTSAIRTPTVRARRICTI